MRRRTIAALVVLDLALSGGALAAWRADQPRPRVRPSTPTCVKQGGSCAYN